MSCKPFLIVYILVFFLLGLCQIAPAQTADLPFRVIIDVEVIVDVTGQGGGCVSSKEIRIYVDGQETYEGTGLYRYVKDLNALPSNITVKYTSGTFCNSGDGGDCSGCSSPMVIEGELIYNSISSQAVNEVRVFNQTGSHLNGGEYEKGTIKIQYLKYKPYSFPEDKIPVYNYSSSTRTIKDVLQTSATSFSDNVALDLKSTNNDGSGDINPYQTGSKGIWRTDASYSYVEDRKSTIETDIKKDGTFDLPFFNYDDVFFTECYPKWRKINTVTQYNIYNEEAENRDILGTYSSALFGHKGSFTTAVASNAKNDEIAFESFEEFDVRQQLDPRETGSGNITIFNIAPDNTPSGYTDYEIEVAKDNFLQLSKISDVIFKDLEIEIYGAPADNYTQKTIFGTYKVAAQDLKPDDATRIILTLDPAAFLHKGNWVGRIRVAKASYSRELKPIANIANSLIEVSNDIAHTGRQSLSLLGNIEMEQYKLKLKEGNYVISAWVKANDGSTNTFKSPSNYEEADKLGLKIRMPGADYPYSDFFEPSGPIIEGWQKIEGEFEVPYRNVTVVLMLNGGKSANCPAVYIDDIRIHPVKSQMKSYVYDKTDYRLRAILDDNNFATVYHYDPSGKLFLLQKETERGMQTIQESISHQRPSK